MKNETARREIESLDYYLQNHTDDYSEESHTAMMMGIKALEQEPCEDAISRQAVKELYYKCGYIDFRTICELPSVNPQPKTGQYEKHIDHTDCIWYGNDSGCPVTCSQYRDGWNDAMDYIFKNGKGYQPYRHDD